MFMKYIIPISLLLLGMIFNPILFWSLVIAIVMIFLLADNFFDLEDVNVDDLEITEEMNDTFQSVLMMISMFIFAVIAIFNLFKEVL